MHPVPSRWGQTAVWPADAACGAPRRQVSVGAVDDIRRASELAWRMVAEYGLSAAIGPVALGSMAPGDDGTMMLRDAGARRILGACQPVPRSPSVRARWPRRLGDVALGRCRPVGARPGRRSAAAQPRRAAAPRRSPMFFRRFVHQRRSADAPENASPHRGRGLAQLVAGTARRCKPGAHRCHSSGAE